jgi:uncharacterized membrane protein YeaQ/YmgE (transglycosylase-associated protein family)
MGIIIVVIVGAIAGWLASLDMGRDASMGIFWSIGVGILGSVLGNIIGHYLFGFGGSIQEFSISDIIMGLVTTFVYAVVGAFVSLLILKLFIMKT